MQLTVVTDDAEVANALLAAHPSAMIQNESHVGTLNADLGSASAIGFTLKSLAGVMALVKSFSMTLSSIASVKPKAKIVLKGPFGEAHLELANITEAVLDGALARVFEIYDRKTADSNDSKVGKVTERSSAKAARTTKSKK